MTMRNVKAAFVVMKMQRIVTLQFLSHCFVAHKLCFAQQQAAVFTNERKNTTTKTLR